MLDKGFTDFILPKYYVYQLLRNDVVAIITPKIHYKYPGNDKNSHL